MRINFFKFILYIYGLLVASKGLFMRNQKVGLRLQLIIIKNTENKINY